MRRQKRKTLKQKKAENSMNPKGKSMYALKKSLQAKGKYSSASHISIEV